MKTILITGSKGQLGNEFYVLSRENQQFLFIFTDIEELDITNQQAVIELVGSEKIDIIINCAAYTNVDKAETDQETAWKINADGVKNLAVAAKQHNALLIHVSTDYVFDGTGTTPYLESDPVKPLGYYGFTKLEGEKAVFDAGCRAVIVRTAWLYSSFGNNFVKTMLSLAARDGRLRVVADQVGSPTYAADLAAALLVIAGTEISEGCEIYNYTNQGVTSWFGFAQEIVRLSELNCPVIPLTTTEFPRPAKRPTYSVLDNNKIIRQFGIQIPDWQDSLARCLQLLGQNN
jgi:dTDP-4-dehydrorhamnose reductase